MKKTLKILFYLALIMAVLFGIGIMIMSSFSGNSPEWKKQVEEIASGLVGKKVLVGQLHEAQLFPELKFDGEYILAEGSNYAVEASVPATPTVLIKDLEFAIPFWTIFWGRPALRHFKLEGGVIVGVDDFIVHQVIIETPKDSIPGLRITGEYQKQPFDFFMEMSKIRGGYIPTKDSQFEGQLNNAQISGIITSDEQKLSLANLNYDFEGRKLNGALDMPFEGGTLLTLSENGNIFIEAEALQSIEDTEESTLLKQLSDGITKNILTNFCAASQEKYVQYSAEGRSNQIIMCYEARAIGMPAVVTPPIMPLVQEMEGAAPLQDQSSNE